MLGALTEQEFALWTMPMLVSGHALTDNLDADARRVIEAGAWTPDVVASLVDKMRLACVSAYRAAVGKNTAELAGRLHAELDSGQWSAQSILALLGLGWLPSRKAIENLTSRTSEVEFGVGIGREEVVCADVRDHGLDECHRVNVCGRATSLSTNSIIRIQLEALVHHWGSEHARPYQSLLVQSGTQLPGRHVGHGIYMANLGELAKWASAELAAMELLCR